MGLKKEKGVQKIVDQFVSSLEAPPEPSLTTDAPVSEGEDMILERADDEESLMGDLAQAELELKGQTVPTEEEIFEAGKRLSVKLVSAFIRRQELRGSDVRLDVGSLYRPEAFPRGSIDPSKWLWHVGLAYRFKHKEHINLLQLKALVGAFEWRLRSAAFSNCRALHLTNSVVSLSAAVRGPLELESFEQTPSAACGSSMWWRSVPSIGLGRVRGKSCTRAVTALYCVNTGLKPSRRWKFEERREKEWEVESSSH